MEVEILSRKLATPSSPFQQHLRSFKISAMDQAEPHTVYPSFISIYQFSKEDCENAVRQQLQKSLSEVLTLYYPLAGRFLDQDKNIITCNDQGVEFIEANVVNDVQISQLHGDFGAKQLNLLVPELHPDVWPLLLVQVSTFEHGGVAIGVRLSHRVADGRTMALFMNGWATASRLRLSQVVPPSLECLPSLFPLRDEVHQIRRSSFSKKEAGGVFVTKKFNFCLTRLQYRV